MTADIGVDRGVRELLVQAQQDLQDGDVAAASQAVALARQRVDEVRVEDRAACLKMVAELRRLFLETRDDVVAEQRDLHVQRQAHRTYAQTDGEHRGDG